MNTRTKIEQYIRTWENRCYYNGIPDEAPIDIQHLVPSYKKIVLAILRNEYSEIFPQPKSEWYNHFKRIQFKKPIKMKTEQEVKQDLDELISVDTTDFSDSKLKTHESRIDFVKTCLYYLQSNPREEFIKKEKLRLEHQIDIITEGYKRFEKQYISSMYNGDESKCRAQYNKQTNLNRLKTLLSNINYLIT